MPAPTLHPAAEQAYRLLPDYMQAADEDADWTLARFTGAAAVGLERHNEFLTLVDPDTSVTGTCELVNPVATPRSYLAWLGWLVGIDTSLLAEVDVRDVILDSTASQRRGSTNAIATAVRRTLTGSKDCVVITKPSDGVAVSWLYDSTHAFDSTRRYDGGITDPYSIIVVTKTIQTPDSVATLAAAMTEKPAGMNLELQTLSGMTYTDLSVGYPTYTALTASNRTYGNLSTSFA